MTKLTWTKLIAIEPRLLDLYREAQAADGSGEHFCANLIWYNHFKAQLFSLVGWECDNPQIRTEEAWDLAWRKIYEALPDCRDCYICM